ncbi:hypothetical protein JCM10908_003265 [Rhodotorula pacifica]|uniref:uncharacterized protein n=1 Tax=Rhodotorula pacifica TaxID=1495444 RepID=UPI00317ADC58
MSSYSSQAPDPLASAAALTAVSLSSLLVEHDNDPSRALASLVSRYNRLVLQHAALRQERDSAVQDATRSAQENDQLWKSLKASSPRPLVARSNSDQQGANAAAGTGAGGTRGLGIGSSGSSPGYPPTSGLETPNLRGTKRMPSHESGLFINRNELLSSSSTTTSSSSPLFHTSASSSPRGPSDPSSHWLDHPPSSGTSANPEPSPRSAYTGQHFSPSSLRGKSATPPPNSLSRQTDAAPPSLLRKASSLDLGRGPGARAASPSAGAKGSSATRGPVPTLLAQDEVGPTSSSPHAHPPRTPPPPGSNLPAFRRVQPSPRISSSASMPLLADSNLERRFLPTLSPVSPFSFGGDGASTSSAGISPRDVGPGPSSSASNGLRSAAAAGEQLQAQLQLPKRERTISSGSSAPLAGPFDERSSASSLSGGGALASPPPPPPRSGSINTLSNASPFRSQQIGEGGGGPASASTSLRERRPPVPSKLQYPPPAGMGLNGATSSSSAAPAAETTSAVSAPTSRRPSDGNAGPAAQARTGLGALPSPTLQAPPISPRTPLPVERQPKPVLTTSLLPHAQIRVVSSSIRINDRHKETVSFQFSLNLSTAPASELEAAAPPPTSMTDSRRVPTAWRVEKSWADLQALDTQIRSKANRQEGKSLASLPDKNLFKDHAPQRSDQRKATIERYLQTLTTVSLRDKTAICNFLTSDVVSSDASPLSSASSAKEGWLTKKGRAFGGWQTRYYILTPGSALSYYDTPGGSKVGEIPLQTAQIGRQSSRAAESGDDAYAHALLIRTQTGKDEADHILCADNDEERDAWIQALTTLGPLRTRSANATTSASNGTNAPVTATERERVFSTSSLPTAPPIPTISHEPDSPRIQERRRSGSGPASMSVDSHSMLTQPPQDPRGLSVRSAGDQLPPSVSLPSNLDALARGMPAMDGLSTKKVSPILEEDTSTLSEPGNIRSSRMTPTGSGAGGPAAPAAGWRSLAVPDRPQSPDKRSADSSAKYSASDVSSPMNAVPLPSGFEFKKIERQKKTKSSFWNFTSRGSSDKANASAPARPVFGVPLKEAVAISRIRPGLELPAIVYRCVEFLEAKNAENEEGIFRLSGSTNVIRQLKERFDAEGDVNLLQSTEFYDLHAIAGLLKQYLRDLPPPLLTRTLQPDFLRVIDLRRREDQVNALGKLVAQLPIEEYTLFRFFFAHLCTIAQNAETSKMNLRNLGIVFSPTLAIPAPLFSLFLSEFDLVFAVDRETGAAKPTMLGGDSSDTASSSTSGGMTSAEKRAAHRNSLIYEASGANRLMESELLRLRENDEDEPSSHDSTGESESVVFDGTVAASHATNGSDPHHHQHYHQGGAPSQPSGSSLYAPSPPRSAGLPGSPRPGTTAFQS